MEALAAKKSGCQQVETQLDAGSKESTRNPLADAAPSDLSDRHRQLSELLTRVAASGPEPYEFEIDSIRQQLTFTDAEREVVTKIFRHGFEAAVKNGDEHKTWAYQRLLRRLWVGQPLDCPITGGNPYLTLSRGTLPPLPADSAAAGLKGIFAFEEGGSARKDATGLEAELSDGEPWGYDKPHLRSPALRHNRLPYAIMINAVALVLWLGPLNTAQRPSHLTKTDADLRHGKQLPIPSAPVGVGVNVNSQGSDLLQSSAPKTAALDTQTTNASPSRDLSKETHSSAAMSVQRTPEKVAVNAVIPPSGTVLRAVQEIGLRGTPQYSAPKGEPLQPGTRFVVMGSEGSWLRVRCEGDGATGYVRREFVEAILPESREAPAS